MNCIALILFILGICVVNYMTVIIIFSYGWFTLRKFDAGKTITNNVKVSVIIPARNEEHNIGNCLESILKQNYPAKFMEVIVVDDHSSDNTSEKATLIFKKYPEISCHLISLSNKNTVFYGKKVAITEGVRHATGELVVCTDADCIVPKNWLKTITAFYANTNAILIIGPVMFFRNKNLFKQLQELEFFSLIASAAGSAKVKMPVMCNGANLAFTRNAFIEVNGYADNIGFPSGDDMFLLEKIKKKFGKNSVYFLKSSDATVATSSINSFSSLLHQRIRWVSKSRSYKDTMIIWTAFSVFSFNLIIFTMAITGLFVPVLFIYLIVAFFIKCIVDFPILWGITNFYGRKKLLWLFLPLQILYSPYVVIMGITGLLSGYRWKERTLSKM